MTRVRNGPLADRGAASMAVWTMGELDRIKTTDELRLAVVDIDGRRRPPVTIWMIACQGDVFIRAVNGRHAVWFRAARAKHHARLAAGEVSQGVELVETQESSEEIDSAYRANYRQVARDIVECIITQQARAATFKLIPRS